MPTASETTVSPESPIPGPLYCDASALAKLFWPETDSDALNRLLVGREDVLVSDLCLTEVASALARRVREGAVEAAVAIRVHRELLAVAAGPAVRRVEQVPATHREAERLLLASRRNALRAVDALHLVMARGAGAGTVLTFDRIMARAA
ncbi:MAG: type II toxin-antitoxin system VapC family toxin, partial [Thermoanaerobaculia bacterium]